MEEQKNTLIAILDDEAVINEEVDYKKGYTLRREFIKPMDCENIYMVGKATSITKLYLTSIDIDDTSFLSSLTNLKTLHLKNCKINSLAFF